MSNKAPSVRMPPTDLPPGAQAFISAASKPSIETEPLAKESVPTEERGLPWEGLDNKKRASAQQLRLTAQESAMLAWAVDTVPGARSQHAYILGALHEKLARDAKNMLGEDLVFNPPNAGRSAT